MDKQLDQLPSTIQSVFEESVQEDPNAQKLPKDVLAAMKAAIPQSFAPERLKGTMVAELSQKLTAQDIKEVLQWLDSPIGKKATKLEEAASTPQAQVDMQQYAASLQTSPPTSERLKALRQFDLAVKATECAVDVAINAQVAVAMAMISTFPAEQRIPPDEISRRIEKNRSAIEAEVRSQVLVSALYTYRSLTDAEIQRYTEFAKSPAGVKYHSATMGALKKAIIEGAVRWGELVGKTIKESKGHSEA